MHMCHVVAVWSHSSTTVAHKDEGQFMNVPEEPPYAVAVAVSWQVGHTGTERINKLKTILINRHASCKVSVFSLSATRAHIFVFSPL